MYRVHSLLTLTALVGMARCADATITVAPTESVMTSGFFTGTNLVRGYDADNRPTLRVSTDNPFATVGAETIYLNFDPATLAGLTGPVPQALLTVTSVSGGFGADAGPANPFTVSAHAVSVDPFAGITDDTNPAGSINWVTFFNDNILPTGPSARTVIDGLGQFQFDVTGIVNDWLAGSNTAFTIALTGKYDTSDADILHGFANNTEVAGSTFLTVGAVPEPGSAALIALGGLVLTRRRKRD